MKTKKSFYAAVFCYSLIAFVFFFSVSRSFGYELSKTFGGSSFEEGKSVQQTADGGFIIAGYTGIINDFQNILQNWLSLCYWKTKSLKPSDLGSLQVDTARIFRMV